MRFLDDLVAIGLATAVLLAMIVLVPDSLLRIIVGLPFVLFFPGYALISALYPRRDDLNGIERLALSLGLSLAIVPLVGLILNFTPWGIRLGPIVISLTLFIAGASIIAANQRKRLSATERFPADARFVLRALQRLPWPALAVSTAVVALVLLLGFRYGVLGGSRVGEAFTEFYVLGPSGKAEGYPKRLLAEQTGKVILGVINHEGQATQYSIQVRAGSDFLQGLGPITLSNNGTWENQVSFSLTHAGKRVKVEFLLFKNGSSAPYRSLHLWLEVLPP